MKTSIRSSVLALACLSALSVNAQSLDCAALANSAEAEPVGYAAQCGTVIDTTPFVVSGLAPSNTGWSLDVRGEARLANTFATFPLNNFATQTQVGVASNPAIFALDFDAAGNVLYGVTASSAAPNPSTLGTINRTTGAFTPIAAVTGLADASATGLSIHPRTGVAYVSAHSGTTGSNLYTLNLATGALTLIGNMTPSTAIIIDIAVNCDGQLYGHNIFDDSLYAINPATGAVTLIGAHGLAANFAQGMDFDNADGQLYGFIYTGAGTNRFGIFNTTNGSFNSLTTNTPLGEFEGAIPTTCAAITNDVSVVKTGAVPTSAALLTQFNFSLTASNAAGGGDASSVVVTDVLTDSVEYVSTTCTGASYTPATRTFTWTIPTLAAGASQTCNLRVAVARGGPITNTATIAAALDSNTSNNSSTVSAGSVTLASVVIPTNSTWALLGLIGVLLSLGLFSVIRRSN